MKTIIRISFVVACLSLMFSCQQTDMFSDDMTGYDLKKAAKNCSEVYTVNSSGGDDTQALIDAFEEAKLSGPGATVQLTEGLYTIGMIEVRDFEGCFMGAGKGKTIIQNLPDLPCEEKLIQNTTPSLLSFIGGNVLISNLTIHLQDGNPCFPSDLNNSFYGDLACVILLADFSTTYIPDKKYIKGAVDNIEVIAGDDGGFGIYETKGNVAMGIYCGSDFMWGGEDLPLSFGDFSITRSFFRDNLAGIDMFATDERSKIVITDNVTEGGLLPVYLGCMMGSDVTFNNNFISKIEETGWMGMCIDGYDLFNVLPGKETKYVIVENKIEVPAGIPALYIRDHFRPKDTDVFPQLFDVKGNTFITEACGMAIMSINNKNAKIWNNKFLGEGAVGVMIDGDESTETYAENDQLIGNNYFGATYTDAMVYLGPYTKNCKVVGVKSDLVVDEGINNSVVGTKAQKKGVQSLAKTQIKSGLIKKNFIQ